MKVKDMKKILDNVDDELEVYLQERTPSSPYHPLFAMCNLCDFNIAIQQNGKAVYLAIGDVVLWSNDGFARADDSEIKYVNPKNKHSTDN